MLSMVKEIKLRGYADALVYGILIGMGFMLCFIGFELRFAAIVPVLGLVLIAIGIIAFVLEYKELKKGGNERY